MSATKTRRKKSPNVPPGQEQLPLFAMLEPSPDAGAPLTTAVSVSSVGALQRHTAAPQLAGYLFQIQRAILRLLDLEEGEALGIELLDDYHIEQAGTVSTLAQVKLHSGEKPASLSDGAADLWKTLGIWARAISAKEVAVESVRQFLLITNAIIPPGSIAEKIAKYAAPEEVLADLLAVPRSRDAKLAADFDAFRDMNAPQRLEFVARLVIVGGQPDLTSSADAIRHKLMHRGFHESSAGKAVEEFCGWVWGRITAQLTSPAGVLISESDFQAVWRSIRDELTASALPSRFADDPVDEAALVGQGTKLYVRQLDLIGASPRVRRRSIEHYLRASAERNTWIEKAEILPTQLQAFDGELVRRWRTLFDDLCDEADGCVHEPTLASAGREHFRAIEQMNHPIQPGWAYQYLTCGSYHRLADALQVGWHSEYRQRLSAAMPPSGDTDGSV